MRRSVAPLYCNQSRAFTGELKVNMLVRLCIQQCCLAAGDVVLFGEPAFSPHVSQRSQMFFRSVFFPFLACQQLCDTQKSHVSHRNRKDFLFSFLFLMRHRRALFHLKLCLTGASEEADEVLCKREFKLSSFPIVALREKLPGNCFVKSQLVFFFRL